MNGKTKQIVTAALFAALTCVATMVIKIPSPMDGYLNLGDCVVLAAGWMLAPGYAFAAAALGSALADVFSGYVMYAPATFVIKGLMALIAFYGAKVFMEKLGDLAAKILSGAAAELWMVLGYFLVEWLPLGYGLAAALGAVGPNLVQGLSGVVIAALLQPVLRRIRL